MEQVDCGHVRDGLYAVLDERTTLKTELARAKADEATWRLAAGGTSHRTLAEEIAQARDERDALKAEVASISGKLPGWLKDRFTFTNQPSSKGAFEGATEGEVIDAGQRAEQDRQQDRPAQRGGSDRGLAR